MQKTVRAQIRPVKKKLPDAMHPVQRALKRPDLENIFNTKHNAKKAKKSF